jgi:hypothetical protein
MMAMIRRQMLYTPRSGAYGKLVIQFVDASLSTYRSDAVSSGRLCLNLTRGCFLTA